MNIPQTSSQQLTNEERKALKNLKNLDHIVILKADKNSTIVVMDKDDYIIEGLRQLASIHYTEVRDTPDPTELANQLMRTKRTKSTKQPTGSCHRQLNKIAGGKCIYFPKYTNSHQKKSSKRKRTHLKA